MPIYLPDPYFFFAEWVIAVPLQGFILIFCVSVDFKFRFSGNLAGVSMPGWT